ncbi:MAG TPA: dihydropteroate synthase [Nitrospirota bacterium]|nr:dihydropteroate synthase [Nitrospirota bacterium]
MLVIAENLNMRNAAYREAVKKRDRKAIETMARELAAKGADVINVQCSVDGIGDEEALPLVTEAVQQGGGLPLCLDSRNAKALKKSVPLCKEPPIINYLSADEKAPDDIFALVRESKSTLILRALKGTVPTSLEAKLMIIEDLIEKANAADIPNERLFADPSVVHIGSAMGQEHLLNAHESIIVLNEMVDPPLNTVVWISNVTSGLPKKMKSRVASAYLSYLAGAGLSAALVDVKDEEIMKTVYLIKSFRDEIIFSPGDIA